MSLRSDMQVLRSQDRALLERCFAVSSEDVINNSVRRLSSPDAVLLLRAAIQRLQSRPLRGEQLQTWIRAMLVWHTAYLISAPGALQPDNCRGQTLRRRLQCQEKLLTAYCCWVQAHRRRWQPYSRQSRPEHPGMSRCSHCPDGWN